MTQRNEHCEHPMLDKYSLRELPIPSEKHQREFCKKRGLPTLLLQNTWLEKAKAIWQQKTTTRTGWNI